MKIIGSAVTMVLVLLVTKAFGLVVFHFPGPLSIAGPG